MNLFHEQQMRTIGATIFGHTPASFMRLLEFFIAIVIVILVSGCLGLIDQDRKQMAFGAKDRSLDEVAPGRYITLSGGEIWYRDTGGEGEPVVLLHPLSSTEEIWKHQFFALSARGFRGIAFAQRGAGRSGDLPSKESQVADDISALLDQLDLHGAHFVGAASGGVHALNYAIANPVRVFSLTLSASLAGVSASELQKMREEFMPPSGIPTSMKALGPSYRYSNPEGVREWAVLERQSILAKFEALPLAEKKARAKIMLKDYKERVDIESVTVPVLLLVGGADLIAPPAYARTIQNRFQNATLKLIPEAGHSPQWETPTLFNQIVSEFLEKSQGINSR
jgi:pimeloyl-ACP methyl ester carboxylesterase